MKKELSFHYDDIMKRMGLRFCAKCNGSMYLIDGVYQDCRWCHDINKLTNQNKFLDAIKEPIEDLAFSQDNPDFCKFGDPAGKIKNDAINSIIEAYKELIK